jgi:hexosaminidase
MEARETESVSSGDTLSSMVPPELLPFLVNALNKAQYDVPNALAQGCRLLISPTSPLYFDRMHADASSDRAQEQARRRIGLPIYSATSIRDGIEWDPVDDTPGVSSDGQIAGVEAAVWCETIASQDELEFMLLPRLAGLAEKAWARQRSTDWSDYAARLGRQSAAWRQRGWVWYRSAEIDWV